MKVKVKDIRPNPYRNTETYKIDREKVDSLKISIQETDFWDNILLREKDGVYQLAYGHHRLQAIKELGLEEIDVPVKDIGDAMMLKIMANENLEAYSPTTSMVVETVEAAKDFIDNELAKYETWEECKEKSSIFRGLFESIAGDDKNPRAVFGMTRGKGAGIQTICAFLGGNWKKWMVEDALKILNDDTVDREAVEYFPTIMQARTFRNGVKNKDIPKEEQKDIAEKIIESGNDSRRKMEEYFNEDDQENIEPELEEEDYSDIVPYKEEARGVDIEKAVQNNTYSLRQIMTGLEEILQNWEFVSRETQVEYEKALYEFFHINRKYFKIEGEKEWNLLPQTK